jgi:hypothetical protein
MFIKMLAEDARARVYTGHTNTHTSTYQRSKQHTRHSLGACSGGGQGGGVLFLKKKAARVRLFQTDFWL